MCYSLGRAYHWFVLVLVPVSPVLSNPLIACVSFAAAACLLLQRPPPPPFLPKGDWVFWFLSVMFVVLAISVCVTWRKHRDTLCAVYIATGGMTSTNLAKTVAWCVCLLAPPRARAGEGGGKGAGGGEKEKGRLVRYLECCLLPLPFPSSRTRTTATAKYVPDTYHSLLSHTSSTGRVCRVPI